MVSRSNSYSVVQKEEPPRRINESIFLPYKTNCVIASSQTPTVDNCISLWFLNPSFTAIQLRAEGKGLLIPGQVKSLIDFTIIPKRALFEKYNWCLANCMQTLSAILSHSGLVHYFLNCSQVVKTLSQLKTFKVRADR